MTPRQPSRNITQAAQRGVTLVEIAIVLVVIGLLLGGVLKGQELINVAKVRKIADHHVSLKVTWFAFTSRFGAMPGDYVQAGQNIPGAGAPEGGGQAFVGTTGDGIIEDFESPRALQNLTGAGFLRCPQCTAQVSEIPSPANSLVNDYGGVIGIFHTGAFIGGRAFTQYAARGTNNGDRRLMTHSGVGIPSHIASEVDRKIDDGIANTGDVVFNGFFISPGAGGAVLPAPSLECMTNTAARQNAPANSISPGLLFWRHASAPVEGNCQFSLVI